MNWLEYIAFRILRLFRKLRLNRIIRVGTSTHMFTDYFKNFEKVEAVRGIFGEKTEEVLRNLKIEFIGLGGYMGVDNTDGHLMVNARYLNSGNKVDIYLDVIHELYHVKQFMEGRELFDSRYDYIERPTEVEAYRYTVQEARRLGLSDERICQYLKTEWMSDSDLKRLAKALDVTC
jgi:hypothetical protein